MDGHWKLFHVITHVIKLLGNICSLELNKNFKKKFTEKNRYTLSFHFVKTVYKQKLVFIPLLQF